MNLPIREAIQSAGRYAFRNPRTMFRMMTHGLGMRVAVPLDALRWLASHLLTGSKAPSDVIITARPPSIAVGATTEMMKQKLRISCSVEVEQLIAGADTLQLTVRVRDLNIKPFSDKSPLNQLIKSGALDLSKPGNLLNFMGKKPPVIVSAKDDRFELDLMQIKAIARNPQVAMALRAVTPVVNIARIRTEDDMLIVGLKATPAGLPQALQSIRQ